MTITAYGETVNYTVQPGDFYWMISEKYDINFDDLMKLNNGYYNPEIYPGQIIQIPYNEKDKILHRVEYGQTFWKISNLYNADFDMVMKINNGYDRSYLPIGDVIVIPISHQGGSLESQKPYLTYENYTVQKGDYPWKIAYEFGIPYQELLKTNGLNESSQLYPGMLLKVPIHHIPIKDTPGSQYGEYLDWWNEAQYVIPMGKTFTVKDFYTGITWQMTRTIGANHADCEPNTSTDSQIIESVWGGFNWTRRPIIILVEGRQIAASMSSMPHDIDYIADNGVTGHMDIHFANSTRHKDGLIDYDHQANVKEAAGIK